MLIEKVLEAARPHLIGRTVQDAVIGLSLIGIKLDDGNVGLSYMLRDELPPGCSSFPYGQELIGKPAIEVAEWVVSGVEESQRGIGMAVITAMTQSLPLVDADDPDHPFGIDVLPTDTVGMIGYIRPIATEFEKKAKKLIIFDKGVSLRGDDKEEVCDMEDQPKFLPTCDIVILSGTTMINGTIDHLLELCQNARAIVMVGASTPMVREAFSDTNVTVLAGSWWDNQHKDEIFKQISLACGINNLHPYMIKKAVKV